MNKYLGIGSGGYNICTNSLRALIAAWLDVSQRNRDCDGLSRSAKEVNAMEINALISPENWILRNIRTYLKFYVFISDEDCVVSSGSVVNHGSDRHNRV